MKTLYEMRYKTPEGFDEEINIKYIREALEVFIKHIGTCIYNKEDSQYIEQKVKEIFGEEIFEYKQPSEEWENRD